MGAPVQHWEFWSQNPEALSAFYSEVFDWQIQFVPEMSYRIVQASDEGVNGGMFQPPEGFGPTNMTFYITVPDLAAYRDKVVAAGGSVIMEEQEVPGMGTFSLFADPDGRVIGIWQEATAGEEE